MNPEVDRLLDLALTQGNPADREATYRQIQYILAYDIPYLNLYWTDRIWVAVNGFGGVAFGGDFAFWNFRGAYWDLDA